MKKKSNFQKAIIRLYRQFDLDLIYVFEYILDKGIDLHSFIKKLLRDSLQGNEKSEKEKSLILNLLHPASNDAPVLRRKIQFHLLLDIKEDSDLIAWIEGITLGYRNTALKETIRTYLGEPCLFPLLTTTNVEFKGEKFMPPEKKKAEEEKKSENSDSSGENAENPN